EEDPGLREVGDVADQSARLLEGGHGRRLAYGRGKKTAAGPMGGVGPTAGTLRSRVEPGAFGSSAALDTQGFPRRERRPAAPGMRWRLGKMPQGRFSAGTRAGLAGACPVAPRSGGA